MLSHVLVSVVVLGAPAVYGQFNGGQGFPSSTTTTPSTTSSSDSTSSAASSTSPATATTDPSKSSSAKSDGTALYTALSARPEYTSLESCQQTCIGDTRTYNYDTEEQAAQNCPNLVEHLNGVPSCMATDSASPCFGNVASIVGAQQVLATFCTSVGTAYGVGIPAVVISTPTDTAAATVATVLTNSGIAASDTALLGATGTAGVVATTTSADSQVTSSSGANSTSGMPQTVTKSKGLSSGAKAGIGVGVALGVLLVLGGIAAFWLLRRRRNNRAAGGPYASVMTSEKGITDSATYSSPHMAPQEMHPMNSAVPFLPAAAAATRDVNSEDRHYEPTPDGTMAPDEPKYSDEPVSAIAAPEPHSPAYQEHHKGAQERPATSRDISRAGTPPALDTQARPATAHARLAPPDDDEPPSPISPVSPISPAGSRPASLRHSGDRHDL